MIGCEMCGQCDAPSQDYYGIVMCDECIRIEKETDWDQFEQDKRERIAEQNEY